VLSEELVSLDKFYCPYGTEVDIQMHHRSKRGFWDGLEFKLSTPSVDWQKNHPFKVWLNLAKWLQKIFN
jgi:hypothetical protein